MRKGKERERKGEYKRDRVKEGEVGRRGDARRLRWLRLTVLAALVLAVPEYVTSGNYFCYLQSVVNRDSD